VFSPAVILHPTDFTNCSSCALGVAADLASRFGSRLIIAHVVETLGPSNVTFGEVGKQLEPDGYRQRLWDDLRRISPPLSQGASVEYLIAEGDPSSGIVRTAEERHCDLIVMGTHGHRGLERLFLGSVAEQVVRRASCPVLTCKTSPSSTS
jgi:nucleotide-binding universal stress UspA family protein